MDAEDDVNLNICILCQGTHSGTLVETPELKSVDNLLEVVKERVLYKDTSVANISKRIKDFNAEQLIRLKVKYHRECYSSVTNKTLLRRAKERYDKAIKSKNAEQITPKRGRPKKRVLEDQSPEISQKLLQSANYKYDKRLCIICQKDNGKLHKVSYLATGEKMVLVAGKLEDKSFLLRLNTIPNCNDAVANDVRYHQICWVYAQREAESFEKAQHEEGGHAEDIEKLLAEIELINVVKADLESGAVLDMNEINSAYNRFLGNTDHQTNYKRDLKNLITNNIPEVAYTKPQQKNKPEKVSLTKKKEEAANDFFSYDSLNMLFQASIVLRKELLKTDKKWIYNKGDLHGGKTTMLYLNLSGH